MKPYTVVIEIELPRSRVVVLFDDASEKFKWQPGLYSLGHVSGEPGRPRAVSKLVYTSGLQRIELTETVTGRDLPRSFESCYRWRGWSSRLRHRFVELSANRTRWECSCTHEVTDLAAKLTGFFFPTLFRRQNVIFQKGFKAFCEEGRDVRDGA